MWGTRHPALWRSQKLQVSPLRCASVEMTQFGWLESGRDDNAWVVWAGVRDVGRVLGEVDAEGYAYVGGGGFGGGEGYAEAGGFLRELEGFGFAAQ